MPSSILHSDPCHFLVIASHQTIASATSSKTMDCSFLNKYQVAVTSFHHPPTMFPQDFVPSPKDVILGRGKGTFAHTGNRRFRLIIAMNLKKYVDAKTKADKSIIVASIVDRVREGSPINGGFVKKDVKTGRWMSIDEAVARDKVGHAMRDAVSASKQAMKESMIDSQEKDQQVRIGHSQQAIFRSLHQAASPDQVRSQSSIALMST